MAYKSIDWKRCYPLGLELHGIVYKVRWVPNTLSDRIVCGLEPFPSPSPPDAPGVLIDGDLVTELSTQEAQEFKASWDPEAEAEDFRKIQQQEEQEFRDTIASDTFLSLPVITVDEMMFAKNPRSVVEIENLLKVKGKPHLVQLLGRTEDQIVLCRYGSCLMESPFDIPFRRRDQWALDLAMGVQVLHSLGITHHDINSRNALYLEDHAILCDLESGPMTYRPPELSDDEDLDHKNFPYEKPADVFLFGLQLWSIQNRNMPRDYSWNALTREGTYASVMDRCLAMNPASRPTINEVVEEMSKLFSDKYAQAE